MKKLVGSKGQNFYFRPADFGWLVFAFLSFWRATEYVYKIWLSLIQRDRIFIIDPPPHFEGGWKIKSCDLWNFPFVCVPNSTSKRNFIMREWLEVPYRLTQKSKKAHKLKNRFFKPFDFLIKWIDVCFLI